MNEENDKIDFYIEKFSLKPHFENGYLEDFYDCPTYTWCYYLLPERERNPLHWLTCDESWQYCDGSPINLYIVDGNGNIEKHIIGPDPRKGHTFIFVIPKYTWFCAEVPKNGKYTLLTHWVTPRWTEVKLIKGYHIQLASVVNDKRFLKKFCWENNRDD